VQLVGIRHVALSVRDLERSAAWYSEVLGFVELFRETGPERSTVIMKRPDTDLLVGLVEFAGPSGDGFDPRHTGLDHLCFVVPSRADLDAWVTQFSHLGVTQSPIVDMATGPILNFRDPDGIALSLATPAEHRPPTLRKEP
jgi:catechol 2,3-dioxygenase-like lactoylglutathione lyase family enzyme